MTTLKLDEGWDVVFDRVKTNRQLETVDAGEEICQCVKQVLTTKKGEWFLNSAFGIDLEKLMGKHVDMDAARDEIYDGIMQDPRITEVLEIRLIPDYGRRNMKVTFKAKANDGIVVASEVELDA